MKSPPHIIDDEIIKELSSAGVSQDFIDKAIMMKGYYQTEQEYRTKLRDVFGDNPGKYIEETLGLDLRLRKREYSGKVTYRADGYLGNYMIIDPESGIVAVRMISHQSFKDEKDNFPDFGKLVLSLAE
jgi:CubicO group peptidase (beta-lactamase class C family)